MSANILRALVEEPHQLERQLDRGIGCVAGMLQIFDRQSALSARRLGHERLPGACAVPTSSSASASFDDGNGSADFSSVIMDTPASDSARQVKLFQAELGCSGSEGSSDLCSHTPPGEPEPSTTPVLPAKQRPRLSFYFEDWPAAAIQPAEDTPASSTTSLTTKGPESATEMTSGSFSSPEDMDIDAVPSSTQEDTGRHRLSMDGSRHTRSASADDDNGRRESLAIGRRTPVHDRMPTRDLLYGRDGSRSYTDLSDSNCRRDGDWSSVAASCRDSSTTAVSLSRSLWQSLDRTREPSSSFDSRESLAQVQSEGAQVERPSEHECDASGDHSDDRELLFCDLQLRATPSGYFLSRDFSRTSVDSRSSRASVGSLSSPDRDDLRLSACDDQKRPFQTETTLREHHAKDVQPPPRSKYQVPNVIARLMGLEELPYIDSPKTPEIVELAVTSRKPSTEAKLLRELLQYKPLDEAPRRKQHSDKPPTTPVQNIKQVPNISAGTNSACWKLADAELQPAQIMLADRAAVCQTMCRKEDCRTEQAPGAKNSLSEQQSPHFKILTETMPPAGEQQEAQQMLRSKYAQLEKQFPEAISTVFQHSEEVRRQQQSSSTLLGEMEQRPQMLRVKYPRQQRKTRRQVLEGMQLKGLLHPPPPEPKTHFNSRQSTDERFIHHNCFGGHGHSHREVSQHKGVCFDQQKSIPRMQASKGMATHEQRRALRSNATDCASYGKTAAVQQARHASVAMTKSVDKQRHGEIQHKVVEGMPVAGAVARTSGRPSRGSKSVSRISRDQQDLAPCASRRKAVSKLKFDAEETTKLSKHPASMHTTQERDTLFVSKWKLAPVSGRRKPLRHASTMKSQIGNNTTSPSNTDAKKGRRQRMPRDISSPQGRGVRHIDAEPMAVGRHRLSAVNSPLPTAAIVPAGRESMKTIARSRGKGRLTEGNACNRVCSLGQDVSSSLPYKYLPLSPELRRTTSNGEHVQYNRIRKKLFWESSCQPAAQNVVTGTASDDVRSNRDGAKDHSFDTSSPEPLTSRLSHPEDVEDNSKQAFSQDMSDLSGGSLSAISLHQDDVKCKGEVLEDEAEQPSPVSVLDTSFHDDICSPGGVDVTTLSLTDADISSRLEALANERACPREEHLLEGDLPKSEPCGEVFAEVATNLKVVEAANDGNISLSSGGTAAAEPFVGCKAERMAYVRDLIISSGFTDESKSILTWHTPSLPMDPAQFYRLEEKRRRFIGDEVISEFGADEISMIQSWRRSEQEAMDRRLLFDCINDITARLLRPYSLSQSWISRTPRIRKPPAGFHLVEKVWNELQELPCFASEDGCDTLYIMLRKDFRRTCDNWLDCSTEIVEVALELEVLIFKQLLEEAILEVSTLTRLASHL